MSTFWTPGGERPIRREEQDYDTDPESYGSPRGSSYEPSKGQPSPEELNAEMDELRKQLSEAPASAVIANHCFGLFELAALHLGNRPPKLTEAQLSIDALAALVENLEGRLGEPEGQLKEGLTQLRLAFVQIRQNIAAEQN